MSLVGGSVTVSDSSGSHTGTGLALALYEARIVNFATLIAAIDVADRQTTYQSVANVAAVDADAIVTYLVANCVVHPGTFTAGATAVTGAGTIT
jgi:hypothetical protein